MVLCMLTFCITFGSILGSVLGSFLGPSLPLYSLLVALGCKSVAKKGSQKMDVKKEQQDFPGKADSWGGGLKRIQSREDRGTQCGHSNTPLRTLGALWRIK